MTAPTQVLTDADIIKIRGEVYKSTTAIFKKPNIGYGGGGAKRPTSGIVFP